MTEREPFDAEKYRENLRNEMDILDVIVHLAILIFSAAFIIVLFLRMAGWKGY